MGSSFDDCLNSLRALRGEYGYGIFDQCLKKLSRERLSNITTREPRKKFPKSMYQKLFDKQGGKCKCCGQALLVPAIKNHIDHFDPSAENFNHSSNLRLLLPQCNLRKSSKSVDQMSRETGRTYVQLLEGEDEV